MKRFHFLAAWFAVVALLIGGLLPAAVSIAAAADAAPSRTALCGAHAGWPEPAKQAPRVPTHHCALCNLCAASAFGLLPTRTNGTAAAPAGEADRLSVTFVAPLSLRTRLDAQPRAPPVTAS